MIREPSNSHLLWSEFCQLWLLWSGYCFTMLLVYEQHNMYWTDLQNIQQYFLLLKHSGVNMNFHGRKINETSHASLFYLDNHLHHQSDANGFTKNRRAF